MFRLSYMQKSEIKGTIKVSKPISGLGIITDIYGVRWDIHAIIYDYVQAVPVDQLHPYFTDTSGASFGFVRQVWNPYKVEVIG